MKQIIVQNTPITIIQISDEDYISLTDMMRAKDGDFFFHNWLRNRNTVEFLGIWEKVHNPDFNSVEFDIIKSQAGPHFSDMQPSLFRCGTMRCSQKIQKEW